MPRLQQLAQLPGLLLLRAKALLHIGLWVVVVAAVVRMTMQEPAEEAEVLL
jgi:hypothetical protein